MEANGGIITEEDLANYQAIVRQPLYGWYRGYQIIAPPPPCSGGVTLIEMLNILEGFDLSQLKPLSPQAIHLMAEAMKLAYYDRARYLGDPAFVSIYLKELTSKAYATKLRNRISLSKALPSSEFGKVLTTSSESEASTHYSVVDFNLKVGLTDDKGNIGTWPNLIEPGKHMLSSMTPVIMLKDGKPYLITGSPGGRRIISTVLEVIVNLIDFQMPAKEAVKLPRFHHQWMPDIIAFEKDAVSEDVLELLKKIGHQVIMRPYHQGNAHSIFIDPKTGDYEGAVDRRRE